MYGITRGPTPKPDNSYEQSIIDRHTTPGLSRGVLTREAMALNMEFNENYRHMTKAERNEFLDKLFP